MSTFMCVSGVSMCVSVVCMFVCEYVCICVNVSMRMCVCVCPLCLCACVCVTICVPDFFVIKAHVHIYTQCSTYSEAMQSHMHDRQLSRKPGGSYIL